MIHRMAVLTSGDGVPGMNAAIRAVTRVGLSYGWEIMGVLHGYTGLIAAEFLPLTTRTVSGIIQRGGSLLGSSDGDELSTEEARQMAVNVLRHHAIDALIVIGGEETQAGAYALSQMGIRVNGIAASIENDIAGADMTLGVDTAINVALDTLDRVKRIPETEGNVFVVEVAGCRSGHLALMSGLAGDAEMVVIPEIETTPEQIAARIREVRMLGIPQTTIVVAEGAVTNAGMLTQFHAHKLALGHMQRGGAPSAFDRMLGTRLGVYAVEALARGEYGIVACYRDDQVDGVPLADVVGKTKQLKPEDLNLLDAVAH